jgi:hypothetical protein
MFEIETGTVARPIKVLLYGAPGIGKSKLASQFKRVLFIDMESGTDFLDVKRIRPKDFGELIKSIKWAANLKEYDTIVFDGLTAIESFSNDLTLAEQGWKTLEDPGYGKGYALANINFSRIVKAADFLCTNQKNVIFIAHSKTKTVIDPTQDSYDRIEFDVNKNMINAFVSAVDSCFYLRPQIRSIETKDKEKKVISNGTRELILSDRGSALSKNRLSHMGAVYEFPHEPEAEKLDAQYKNFWELLTHNTQKKAV